MRKVFYFERKPQRHKMTTNQPHDNKIIELPALEQIKKGLLVVRGGKYRSQYATKLEKYHAGGSISEDQYRAGDRLYQDAYHGGVLNQLKAIDYTKAKEGGRDFKDLEQMSWLRADKHKQFSDAMFCTEIGRVQRDILWWVCIFDCETSGFSDNRNFAIGLLRETLNELARYYKNCK